MKSVNSNKSGCKRPAALFTLKPRK